MPTLQTGDIIGPGGGSSENRSLETGDVIGPGDIEVSEDQKDAPSGRENRKRNPTDNFFSQGLHIDIYHVPSGENVKFKAFLNQYEDNFDASWNEEEVYGRNDPLITFEGTRRTINLGWSVVADGPHEALNNMRRVSTLIQMLYPHYDVSGQQSTSVSSTSISAAPLLKIRMMNWMVDASEAEKGQETAKGTGLLGKPDGISFNPNLDMGMIWGHEINDEQADSYKMYPKEFDLEMEFLVNHLHPLGWHSGGPRTPSFPYAEHLGDADFVTVEKPTQGTATRQQEKQKKEELTGGAGGGRGNVALHG